MSRNSKNKAKQEIFENFELQSEQLLNQGYKEYTGTMSVIKINLMALVTAGPFALLAIIIYMLRWGELSLDFNLLNYFAFLFLLILSIFIHEFLHGLTWHFFCKKKWKSIKFGVMWEYLTPYCHCKEPLRFSHYILGGLMPFFVLGIGLSVLGILLHSNLIIIIGALNILSAGGDTTISCMLLPYRNSILIDHPSACGFVAFKKE